MEDRACLNNIETRHRATINWYVSGGTLLVLQGSELYLASDSKNNAFDKDTFQNVNRLSYSTFFTMKFIYTFWDTLGRCLGPYLEPVTNRQPSYHRGGP